MVNVKQADSLGASGAVPGFASLTLVTNPVIGPAAFQNVFLQVSGTGVGGNDFTYRAWLSQTDDADAAPVAGDYIVHRVAIAGFFTVAASSYPVVAGVVLHWPRIVVKVRLVNGGGNQFNAWVTTFVDGFLVTQQVGAGAGVFAVGQSGTGGL